MLDRRTLFLLKKIDELCDDGKYKIVDEAELISAFPKEYPVDRASLKQMLSYLSCGQYVTVKYSDRGMYCLCISPSGRRAVEHTEENGKEGASYLSFLLPFLGALAGGAVSSLIAFAVFFALRGKLC